MVIVIRRKRTWLWRAVDNEGEVLDFRVQRRRDAKAARRLMKKLLKKQGFAPSRVVTDKLRSYASASPIRSRPVLVLVSTDPARILSRLWSRPRSGDDPFLRSVVFTSATLSNDDASNWSGFMREMGINPAWSNYASARSASFEPKKFGSVEFMLAACTVPAPCKKDSTDHDPAWLDYVVQGIEAAREKGGRVLVLANSYTDAEALGQRLDDVLTHRRGEPLGPLIASYKAQSDAVLITPAASPPGRDQEGTLVCRLNADGPSRVARRRILAY